MTDFYQDKLFWEFEGQRFHNKAAALNASGSIDKLRFNFFDQDFITWNWTTEPEESLPDLLVKRALQLREKFDYIRLWYSGGVDSHTALKTFVDHQIPIDEVLVYRCSPTDEFEGLGNMEVNQVALPYLQSVQNQLKNTKIRLINFGYQQYKKIYRSNWLEDSNVLRFRPYSRHFAYQCFPELLEPHNRHRLCCDLIGKDKPRLLRGEDDRKIYAFYWDNTFTSIVADPFTEYFFISPDFPKLHLKQCHMVKNWIKKNVDNDQPIDFLFKEQDNAVVNELCRHPLWKNLTFNKKGEVDSPKAEIAAKECLSQDVDTYKHYQGFLSAFAKDKPHFFNEGDWQKSFIGVRTKLYCLEP